MHSEERLWLDFKLFNREMERDYKPNRNEEHKWLGTNKMTRQVQLNFRQDRSGTKWKRRRRRINQGKMNYDEFESIQKYERHKSLDRV